MRINLNKENYGKFILIGISILLWLLILFLFKGIGYRETWELWKVPTAKDIFLDFQLIPGSAESFRHGFEPTLNNPFDPAQRIFNYPAFWRLFFYTGIKLKDTIWFSIMMIVLFFIGIFLFPDKLSILGAIGMLFVTFSPAAMLLYERANVDLILFFVCAMIVVAESYSSYGATMLIMLGSIMKMYPFFGVTVLWKESRNKFWSLLAASLGALVLYMVATLASIEAAWNSTMRGDDLSYGTNILVTRYGIKIGKFLSQWFSPLQVQWLLAYGMLIIALIILLVIFMLALQKQSQPIILSERNLAAFRMGASIYVGTFLLGNNWDYRLAFLVFLVPQLVEWMGSNQTVYRRLSWSAMLLVLASCWYMWISAIPVRSFLNADIARRFWIVVDELFNWLLFANLAYLLITCAPDWLKEQFGSLVPRGSTKRFKIQE